MEEMNEDSGGLAFIQVPTVQSNAIFKLRKLRNGVQHPGA
jgi:hypothetical protein